MNIIEVYQKLAEDISLLIESKIKNIKADHTFKAKVIEDIGAHKYKILHKDKFYTAKSPIELDIDDLVYVCAPENNWSELFILFQIPTPMS